MRTCRPAIKKRGVTRSATSSRTCTRESLAGRTSLRSAKASYGGPPEPWRRRKGPALRLMSGRRSPLSKTATVRRVSSMPFSTAIVAAVSGRPLTPGRRSPHDFARRSAGPAKSADAERSPQAVRTDVPSVLRVGRVVCHARHLARTDARLHWRTDWPRCRDDGARGDDLAVFRWYDRRSIPGDRTYSRDVARCRRADSAVGLHPNPVRTLLCRPPRVRTVLHADIGPQQLVVIPADDKS